MKFYFIRRVFVLQNKIVCLNETCHAKKRPMQYRLKLFVPKQWAERWIDIKADPFSQQTLWGLQYPTRFLDHPMNLRDLDFYVV